MTSEISFIIYFLYILNDTNGKTIYYIEKKILKEKKYYSFNYKCLTLSI
jgi:hypothetical protein